MLFQIANLKFQIVILENEIHNLKQKINILKFQIYFRNMVLYHTMTRHHDQLCSTSYNLQFDTQFNLFSGNEIIHTLCR